MIGSQSAGDRLSELPDEILHHIVDRIEPSITAGQIIALSRRWRGLWPSYPVVKFSNSVKKDQDLWSQSLEKFSNATIQRFSKDTLLSMVTLKLSLIRGHHDRAVELLDLASQRKAQHVEIAMPGGFILPLNKFSSISAAISAANYRFSFPLKLLSNPAAKTIRLRSVEFSHLDFPLSLNSLRFLHLESVTFDRPDRDLSNLIASSPLLETLQLVRISQLKKLKVCTHLPNLKTLEIVTCFLDEVEIAAPGLHTLQVRNADALSKLELTAPNLNVLETYAYGWSNLEAVISKLPSLKSLILTLREPAGVKKLKLSSPVLDELTLISSDFEEIEVDAGPCLAKFVLHIAEDSVDMLKRCRVSPACRWEVEVKVRYAYHFVELKSLLTRFPQISTVIVLFWPGREPAFTVEELDHTLSPVDIKHLLVTRANKLLLEGAFSVIHPELLTIRSFHRSESVDSLFLDYLEMAATPRPRQELLIEKEVSNECRDWRRQLKDIKIVTEEVEDRELISLSKTNIARLAGQKNVCFRLTWHSD